MAEGRSNVAIAEELVVSAGAVEKHVRNIFTKLDLPPDPDDHRRGPGRPPVPGVVMRKLLVVSAGLVAVVTLATGCYALVDLLALEHHGRTYELDPTGTVHLDVDGGGTVRVVGDGGDGVRVESRWRVGISAPSISVRRQGDQITVRTRCPQFLNLVCRVSATVHVPQGTLVTGGGDSPIQVIDVAGRVDLASDDGSIRVEGAKGWVRVATSNGGIAVADSVGDLSLSADNGRITTRAVRVSSLVATTSNGRIARTWPPRRDWWWPAPATVRSPCSCPTRRAWPTPRPPRRTTAGSTS